MLISFLLGDVHRIFKSLMVEVWDKTTGHSVCYKNCIAQACQTCTSQLMYSWEQHCISYKCKASVWLLNVEICTSIAPRLGFFLPKVNILF